MDEVPVSTVSTLSSGPLSSVCTQADPSRVLGKLITFAVLMAVVPIGTYFITLNWLYAGELLVRPSAPVPRAREDVWVRGAARAG